MPTNNKWIDKELLDDAFKAIDIFKEEGWEKGFDFLDVAKEKKERRKEIDESSGTYKIIKKKEYKIQEEEERCFRQGGRTLLLTNLSKVLMKLLMC